ncbi:MAG: hypothetical protein ACP5I8_12685 [Phycisphaerae bacterium]
MSTILDKINIIRVASGAAAGVGTTYSAIVDMADYDGVVFVASLNTLLATSVVALQLQESATNTTGGMANVGSPATYTAPTGGTAAGTLVVDTDQPLLQYVRAQLSIATADSTVDAIWAIQYRGRIDPTTLDPTVLASLIQVNV